MSPHCSHVAKYAEANYDAKMESISLIHCCVYTLLLCSTLSKQAAHLLSRASHHFYCEYNHSLERIILWCNLMFVEVANDWNFLNNVLSHAWDVGEEEEGEDTGCGAEVACCFAEYGHTTETYAVVMRSN